MRIHGHFLFSGRLISLWVGLWGLAMVGGYDGGRVGLASPPWMGIVSTKKVEADPKKSYTLTPENGPWLIMACSFSGERAEQQAKELILELRQRYKLNAYMHRMHFHVGEEVLGRGVDRYGNPVRMKYRRPPQFDEIAVMVGDFPAVDDPEAQRTLEKIKYCQPECLKPTPEKPTSQNLAAWRIFTKYVRAEKESLGPMCKAFLTTNPLLPREYFAPKGMDALVEKMNADLPYSLLRCPGKYTVQVAMFTGTVVIDPQRIQRIQEGVENFESSLDKAAWAAHKLTEALRMKGYEAYEFHDRYASIVTVGSFDSVGTPRADGKIELNPQIYRIMELFRAEPADTPGMGPKVKTLAGIPFDPQPIPVQVPQRSLSADYRQDSVRP